MNRPDYRIVLEPLPDSEGGGYMATVPDLPGCISDGATDIEALENAHDAIRVWIERAVEMGRDIPKPTPVRIYA
jgi:predicted RNase H-like HicB family nuclease